MPRRSQSCEDLQARLAELSGWRTATRDDGRVAQALHQTRSVDRVHALNEAAFFDELFHYVREIGVWPLLEGLDSGHREGALYPFLQFVLFTIMRCVGGVQSLLATHDLLLTDESLMEMLGFNAVQVREGSNKRGLSQTLAEKVSCRLDGHPGVKRDRFFAFLAPMWAKLGSGRALHRSSRRRRNVSSGWSKATDRWGSWTTQQRGSS